MQVEQLAWHDAAAAAPLLHDANLVLAFGAGALLEKHAATLRSTYPAARLIGCTTAGEIEGEHVRDGSLVTTAVRFDKTTLRAAQVPLSKDRDSRQLGRALAESLLAPGLQHVFVLCDGIQIDGTELVAGMTAVLPRDVAITGGLAGDGSRFVRTQLLTDTGVLEGAGAAIGFYGTDLRVGYGSLGGWDSYGPKRRVTKSTGNVLVELDGKNALVIYKEYLGDYAKDLPASGLLFPLSMQAEDERVVVRTILGVDEAAQTMRFAGDLPEGTQVRFMRANFDRLVDGAMGAAKSSVLRTAEAPPQLAVLISCVGRKLVLGQRIEEEVEGVRAVLGPGPVLAGFYSYGEISPFAPDSACAFHNQTMTITTFAEV
jgi:hypothetical protein